MCEGEVSPSLQSPQSLAFGSLLAVSSATPSLKKKGACIKQAPSKRRIILQTDYFPSSGIGAGAGSGASSGKNSGTSCQLSIIC